MTVFRGIDWIKERAKKVKAAWSDIQWQNLTAKISQLKPWYIESRINSITWFRTYKVQCLKVTAAAVLVGTFALGGVQLVNAAKTDSLHVLVAGHDAGIVSNRQAVDDFIAAKTIELDSKNPKVHQEFNLNQVTYKTVRAFKKKIDDGLTLQNVGKLLTSRAVGVQLKVDGKLIAIVKDQETANQILTELKNKYTNGDLVVKKLSRVQALSASSAVEQPKSQTELVSVDFTEKVDLESTDIQPDDIMEPAAVLNKLESGDVQPTTYTVENGDCISCIANKLGISQQLIYDKNPSIVDDKLSVGQVLDVTMIKPTLTVRTVEKFVEDQTIQFDTTYQKDATLRQGQTRVVTSGKNGMKKVTYQQTKENGMLTNEDEIKDEVVEEPVTAVVLKGSKVIRGIGSGKFAWPVIGASISSGFGMRWGKLHKGIDITGNKSIMAADSGTVVAAGVKPDYGKFIIIDHGNGYQTLYAHLSRFLVTSGKIVEKGDIIGIMGETGDAQGVHLHFEIHVNGSVMNPMKYMR